ncbi:DUF1963 domain-containing protein [Actinomadura oligospora]|uniref:DUF1963 domain-containing protein n=1 Tax=Actinomadura oligospora TaxID=111804 RepID=UPI00047BB325|nr:DUF1963 domain-containing protein [Actinomadura oligospora]
MNTELFRRLHPLFSAFLTPETAGILLSLARPALRLISGGSAAVYLGGHPLLPPGEPWPTTAGRPMEHLGTIDLAAIPSLDGLPTLGHASFYHSGVTPSPWDDASGPREAWRVYARDLEPAESPVSTSSSAARSWGVAPFWSLPSPLEPTLDLLEQARPGTLSPYGALYGSWLDQVWPDDGPRHQIGGWPVLLEAGRPVGPEEPCAVNADVPKPPPYPDAEAVASTPMRERRSDQVLRLTDHRGASGKRSRRRPVPSLRDPLQPRFGRIQPRYAMSSALVPPPLVSVPARSVGNAPGQPTACHPSEAEDGDRSAMKPVSSGLDRGRFGSGSDPAFVYPRTPRRSVSVLPANVDSTRLEEVRAAIAAARSRSSEDQDVLDREAKRASDARKAETKRLADRLRTGLNSRRLILQLDADPRLGWFWGDPGCLLFTVEPDAPLESAWLNRHAL